VVRPALGVHPRHPPRTFPLGLLAPRCLGLALLLALPPCGAGARAPAVWGKEGILPPASVSSSQWFARVFSALFWLVVCVCLFLRCSCLRSPPSHNPLPRFQNSFRGVASASDLCIARLRRRSSKGVDALAEMSEARSRMCLPLPPCARTSRPRRTEGIAGGALPYCVINFFSISSSNLVILLVVVESNLTGVVPWQISKNFFASKTLSNFAFFIYSAFVPV
jgi:hypothetical protein